jgi:hypothetical protein
MKAVQASIWSPHACACEVPQNYIMYYNLSRTRKSSVINKFPSSFRIEILVVIDFFLIILTIHLFQKIITNM